MFVVFAKAALGRQLNTPLAAPMVAAAGGLSRPKDNWFVGKSESVAVAVKVMVWPEFTTRLPVNVKAGAAFTSFTMTTKEFVAYNVTGASSQTIVVNVFVEGPSVSVVVQVMTPFEEIIAAAGAASSA